MCYLCDVKEWGEMLRSSRKRKEEIERKRERGARGAEGKRWEGESSLGGGGKRKRGKRYVVRMVLSCIFYLV